MSEIDGKVVDILEKLERMTEQFAPEVIDLAVNTVRFGAIGELIILTVFTVLCALALYKYLNPLLDYFRSGDLQQWGCAATMIISAAWIINVFKIYFNEWIWIAVFNPELALAHKILGL